MAGAAAALKAQPEHLLRKLEQLIEERERLQARVNELLRGGAAAPAEGTTLDIGGVAVTLGETAVEDREEVLALVDGFRTGKSGAVLVLFGTSGRGAVHVAVTDDLVKAGRKAGDLARRIAAVSGGKGGGRPQFASAGAGDVARLPAARAEAPAHHRHLAPRGRMTATAWLAGADRGRPARARGARRRRISSGCRRVRRTPRRLAAAARLALDAVLAQGRERSAALDLLVADSLRHAGAPLPGGGGARGARPHSRPTSSAPRPRDRPPQSPAARRGRRLPQRGAVGAAC